MKYPPAPLSPFHAVLSQKPQISFHHQPLVTESGKPLTADASRTCALSNPLVALFRNPSRLFSIACSLFSKNPRVGYPARFCGTASVAVSGGFAFHWTRAAGHRSRLFNNLQTPPSTPSICIPRVFIRLQIPFFATRVFSRTSESPPVFSLATKFSRCHLSARSRSLCSLRLCGKFPESFFRAIVSSS